MMAVAGFTRFYGLGSVGVLDLNAPLVGGGFNIIAAVGDFENRSTNPANDPSGLHLIHRTG